MYRIKPSKPAALFGAVFGLAILIFGVVKVGGKSHGLIWLWVVFGLAIIGFNLWAAFSKNGSTGQLVEKDPSSAGRR